MSHHSPDECKIPCSISGGDTDFGGYARGKKKKKKKAKSNMWSYLLRRPLVNIGALQVAYFYLVM